MAGDEIDAEWLGDIWSDRVTTSTTPTKFSSTIARFRDVVVCNNNASNYAYVGKYYGSDTEFIAKACIIWEKCHLKFQFIDINQLAFRSCSGAQYLSIICVNQY